MLNQRLESNNADSYTADSEKCSRLFVTATEQTWTNRASCSRTKTRIVWLFVAIEPEGNDGGLRGCPNCCANIESNQAEQQHFEKLVARVLIYRTAAKVT